MSQPADNDLLLEGIAAARAGDDDEARRLLRRVTELEPDNVQGWIWRASVAENPADKKAYLEEALLLEPDNAEAQLALARVAEREGERVARVASDDEVFYCTVHPDRETMLRCNRCGRPMCTECAVRHPVGMRCRSCVNETRSPIYQFSASAGAWLFGLALLVGLPTAALGLLALSFMAGALGLWGFLIGFAVGGAIGRGAGEMVVRFGPRKRGRAAQGAVAAGLASGLALILLGWWLLLGFPNLLVLGLYLLTVFPAAVASLR